MAETHEHAAETDMCMPTGAQHERLRAFEGVFKAVVKMYCGPGEPMVSTGVMTNTMVLGGRFLEHVYKDDSGMFEGRGYWGYNTASDCYEGIWIDNMSTMIQIEIGHADGDTWNMSGTSTDPGSGKPMATRSVTTLSGPDEHGIEMFCRIGDGEEFKSMEIHYTRA